VHHQYCGQLGKQAQLPGGGDAVDRQSSWQSADRLSAVFAASLDGRQSAARRGTCAALGQVQDQAAACAGADPRGCEGEGGSRCCADGRGVWNERRSAPGDYGLRAGLCGSHHLDNQSARGARG
jgi:hypothetical protein